MPSSTKNCVLSHPTSPSLDQTLGPGIGEKPTVTTPAKPQPPRVTPGDRHQDAYLAPCQRLWREASRSIRRAQISAANERSKVIGSLAKSHLMDAVWCKFTLAYPTVNIAISCYFLCYSMDSLQLKCHFVLFFNHHWLASHFLHPRNSAWTEFTVCSDSAHGTKHHLQRGHPIHPIHPPFSWCNVTEHTNWLWFLACFGLIFSCFFANCNLLRIECLAYLLPAPRRQRMSPLSSVKIRMTSRPFQIFDMYWPRLMTIQLNKRGFDSQNIQLQLAVELGKKNMTHQHQTTLNLSGCITPILNCNGPENPMKLPNSLKQNSDWSQILELWQSKQRKLQQKKQRKNRQSPRYWRNLWPTVVKLRSRLRRYPKSAVECSRGLPCEGRRKEWFAGQFFFSVFEDFQAKVTVT